MDQWAEEDEEEEEEEAAAAKQRKNLIFSATELIGTYHLENMENRNEYRQAKESGYDWVIRTLGIVLNVRTCLEWKGQCLIACTIY
jgi:hypothetical protein